MKYYQSVFSKGPKGLDVINTFFPTGKFIITVMDSVMLFIAYINQAIIATPTIRMKDLRGSGLCLTHLHSVCN